MDSKLQMLLDIADDLNKTNSVDTIGQYYIEKSGEIQDNKYNLIVFLLGMCVNKEITLRMPDVETTSVEDFPALLIAMHKQMVDDYKTYNRIVIEQCDDMPDRDAFLEYLDDILVRLLSGVKYIEKKEGEPWIPGVDEYNEWNTSYRREERIRDAMKKLIVKEKGKFTVSHGIELPYMYVLAWDLPNMLNEEYYLGRNEAIDENETSYIKLLSRNVRKYLQHLNDDLFNIFFNGSEIDKNKFELDTSIIKICKQIDFTELLPMIVCVDQKEYRPSWRELHYPGASIKAEQKHEIPYVKREILCQKPLIPVKLERKDHRELKKIVDVLKEECKVEQLTEQLEEINKQLKQKQKEEEENLANLVKQFEEVNAELKAKEVELNEQLKEANKQLEQQIDEKKKEEEENLAKLMQQLEVANAALEEAKVELEIKNTELEAKNSELKRMAEQKSQMMDYYAHSWKHISYPQIVKEIAEELANSNVEMANRLMKVYNSERTLQRGIQLLQYISSNDEEKVKKEFRNGMGRVGKEAKNQLSLYKVLCDSIDLVVFKLLMVESDDSRRIEICRERWGRRKNLNILQEEYSKTFLRGAPEKEDIIQWVNKNLLEIDLVIDCEWEQVRFKEDSFAVNQFKEILVEIVTNAFLHGEDKMELYFEANDQAMKITAKNEYSYSNAGEKSGISTMQTVLDRINIGTDIKSIQISEVEENRENPAKFELVLQFNKRVLIRKGW